MHYQEQVLTIKIFTTGGTFDKIYFDAKSEFHIGEPIIGALLEEANVGFAYDIESLIKKDSLDMDLNDRKLIRDAVDSINNDMILITHGTDTIVETAAYLVGEDLKKTIVLTGAMQPARFRNTDAIFNIGYAISAAQHLPHGIYLAMNGQIFTPDAVQKNRDVAQFEAT